MSDTNNLPHLFVQGFVSSEKYTYAGPVPMGEAKMPPRDRAAHGVSIREQLHQARQQNENLRGATINDEEPSRIILEVHSEPDFELELKSLEPRSQGVELACVREEKDEQGRDQRIAVIHVPAGRLNYFVKLVEQYLTAQVASGKPKNQKLIESISRIRLATLRSFWTDDGVEFPLADKAIWWEVWLRASGDQSPWDSFALLAEQAGLGLGKETIRFPDRLVGLCYGTPDQLSSAAEILDMLAEARRAKENPAAFIAFGPIDQAEWVAGLRTRIAEPAADAPAVCVLDRGMVVNPLLEAALSPADLHKYDPSWPLSDPVTPFDAEAGHGTEMADVALFGDQLPELLAGSQAVPLRHRLESVRILPPRRHPDDPRLYGAITAQAAYRVESYANRPRVFCMAVTADGRDRGKPTSWSGEVDQLCAGVRDGHRRLFVVSAGNTALDQRHRYPESNDTDPVQDPAQAWNAVTVGAFTDRVQFPQVGTFSGSRPIAHAGDLSPSSTTSLGWLREWPFKPDVVLEGGNQVFHPVKGWVLDPDEMALLTTAHATGGTLLVNFRDTSAATAQAARMLAIIRAEYPDYWPETVRALLVHSAVWNPSMRQAFCDQKVGEKKRAHWRLRRYGVRCTELEPCAAVGPQLAHADLARESPTIRESQKRTQDQRHAHPCTALACPGVGCTGREAGRDACHPVLLHRAQAGPPGRVRPHPTPLPIPRPSVRGAPPRRDT